MSRNQVMPGHPEDSSRVVRPSSTVVDPVLTQGDQAPFQGKVFNGIGVWGGEDQPPQFIVNDQHLKDAYPAAVAGAQALIASPARVQHTRLAGHPFRIPRRFYFPPGSRAWKRGLLYRSGANYAGT